MPSPLLIDIDWAGRPVTIEHAFVGVNDPQRPLIVFLHEGLGSLAMWRDFPQRLCEAAGCRGLVYSRPATASRPHARPTRPGAWTSCTARPTRCCRPCWPRSA